jgi:hypothetical protein
LALFGFAFLPLFLRKNHAKRYAFLPIFRTAASLDRSILYYNVDSSKHEKNHDSWKRSGHQPHIPKK